MSYLIFSPKLQVSVEIEEIPWSEGAKPVSPRRFRISSRAYFKCTLTHFFERFRVHNPLEA